MREHLIQCKKSILPLLKCLKPPIDVLCIHSAVSLFPLAQSPDPLAVEAELQVLLFGRVITFRRWQRL
jgi:hypothetical protein